MQRGGSQHGAVPLMVVGLRLHPAARSSAPGGCWRPRCRSAIPRPALPPHPSWRIRSRMVRIGRSRCAVCASFSIRSLPQRSQVIRMNHEGNALYGSSRASAPRWQSAGRSRRGDARRGRWFNSIPLQASAAADLLRPPIGPRNFPAAASRRFAARADSRNPRPAAMSAAQPNNRIHKITIAAKTGATVSSTGALEGHARRCRSPARESSSCRG
jgi:hypothetical protein